MKRGSKYWEFFCKSPENIVHKAVTDYIRLQFPDKLWIHVPNEGKRSAYEQYVAKLLGLTAGVPDILIFDSDKREFYKGLAIELKARGKEPTQAQLCFLIELCKRGWDAKDFDNSEEAIKYIWDYFKK